MTSSPPLPAAVSGLPMEDLTPRQIVSELDKYIVGQGRAKRAVAIALRNRWRRQRLAPALRAEITPKNLLLIGPTGVGKTEIARRLARLARAPFLKIEASKFTEVGYVGRDCESIVRDLVEIAVGLVREEKREAARGKAQRAAEERLLDLLLPPASPVLPVAPPVGGAPGSPASTVATATVAETRAETREKLRERLRAGGLDDRVVEIETQEQAFPSLEMVTPQGVEEVGINLKEMLPGFFARTRKRQTTVSEAREILVEQETEGLLDRQQIAAEARERAEQSGIVFLDEIDKIAGRERSAGPDVSREGVQRDLLPIVEGTTVSTKYGPVKTDHVLFVAAGAFHVAKPSDLIPELQGRFPIRVELDALTEADFVRILTEPENALTRQYAALLSVEGLTLEFTADAIVELARLAVEINSRTENIGARRLATLLEKVLEEVSFEAADMAGMRLVIDQVAVDRAVADIARDDDLSRYVL